MTFSQPKALPTAQPPSSQNWASARWLLLQFEDADAFDDVVADMRTVVDV